MADLKVVIAKGAYRKDGYNQSHESKKNYISDTYEVRALDGVSLVVKRGRIYSCRYIRMWKDNPYEYFRWS